MREKEIISILIIKPLLDEIMVDIHAYHHPWN